MPCSKHDKVDADCVECFAADILAFTLGNDISKMKEDLLDQGLRRLVKRYEELKDSLSKDDNEYCNTLIFGLNTKLAGRKHAMFGKQLAVFLDPNTIQFSHRELYRARLRKMGTWIGFTEFVTMADIYRIRFWLAVPSGNRWRRWEVGDPRDPLIANPALLWTGNHYEVATLTLHVGQEYTATNRIATNPRGDCALESFLFMLHNQLAPPNPGGGDRYRALRVLTLFGNAHGQQRVDGLIDAGLDDYKSAIGELRGLLANEITSAQINDAIIAEGVLPGSKEQSSQEESSTDKVDTSSQDTSSSGKIGKLAAWTEYREGFEENFAITQTVVEATAGKVTCVANLGAAADWLAVVQNLDRHESWSAMKKAGLKSHVHPVSGSLTHTGLMVAQVTTADDALIFACAAANYHQSLRETKAPWIYKDSNQKLGKGRDMHTERFGLVQLDTWIGAQKLVPTGTIEILWFIEKPMCEDECVPVLNLFVNGWNARGVKVGSDVRSDNLHEDYNFNKNLGKALKRFPTLR